MREKVQKEFNLKDEHCIMKIQHGREIEFPPFVYKTHIPETDLYSLITFINRTTSRESKAFSCDYVKCGKLFKKWHNLLDHLRVHTMEKPFECPLEGCNLRFNQMSNRKAHMGLHSKNAYVKCKKCLRLFTKTQIVDHFDGHFVNLGRR